MFESDCIKCDAAYRESLPVNDIGRMMRRMILCPSCGNKRCPKATDHELLCSGSNESGQLGSIY